MRMSLRQRNEQFICEDFWIACYLFQSRAVRYIDRKGDKFVMEARQVCESHLRQFYSGALVDAFRFASTAQNLMRDKEIIEETFIPYGVDGISYNSYRTRNLFFASLLALRGVEVKLSNGVYFCDPAPELLKLENAWRLGRYVPSKLRKVEARGYVEILKKLYERE